MAGTAPRGTKLLVVRAGGQVVATRHLRGRRFDLRVPLPRRDVTVRVTATTLAGRRSSASVVDVFGLPRSARPRGSVAHLDGALARRIVPLVRAFPGASAVYVRDLATGAGTAWNARAHFPAGSTLKLAIAVEALRTLPATPVRGSYADRLLRGAIVYSDNVAANALEVLFGGSTSGGSYRVNSLMGSLGLGDSEMYGGYIPGTLVRRRPIPLRKDEQPYYGVGKHTSAYDLAQLFAYIHLASERKGRLAKRHPGFSAGDARYLLYLLAHVTDRGKLDRFLAGRASSLHKAGWITTARHDAGLVYWPGGVFAVAVMTHGAGVGTASDVLAGRVARRSLDVLRARARAVRKRDHANALVTRGAGNAGVGGRDAVRVRSGRQQQTVGERQRILPSVVVPSANVGGAPRLPFRRPQHSHAGRK
ncbi:MAG TPA: serine hydrolase [Gaiellaceae bacterium]|nr:serine hydrolase [Gaiellaceae bacterium]